MGSEAFATTYYVDPAATGSNNGTSWTDAWTTIQTAFDTAVAGDIVYCRGSETTPAGIDIDSAYSGNITTGLIKFIGVNSSGTNDGTYYTINGTGSSAGVDGLRPAGPDFLYLENIRVTAFAGDGMDNPGSTESNNWYLNHCAFDHNGEEGIETNAIRFSLIFRCTFNNNVNGMVTTGATPGSVMFSSFHHNSGVGAYASNENVGMYIGCLFYSNGTYGLTTASSGFVYNCSFDSNGTIGFQTTSTNNSGILFIGNRVTNHSGTGDMGVNAQSRLSLYGFNYFENNTGDNISNGSVALRLGVAGVDTNSEDQSNTLQGYTDDDPKDFNLNTSATIRRNAITVPTE